MALAILSAAISGRSVFVVYPSFLLHQILAEGKRASVVSRSDSASRLDFDAAFGGTVMFAMLVSYHLNPPRPQPLAAADFPADALCLAATTASTLAYELGDSKSAGNCIFAMLHLWALEVHSYDWISVPPLLLFLTNGQAARPDQAERRDSQTTSCYLAANRPVPGARTPTRSTQKATRKERRLTKIPTHSPQRPCPRYSCRLRRPGFARDFLVALPLPTALEPKATTPTAL